MKRCKVCEGRKTIIGMGNMREKCKSCDGKGFFPEEKIKVTAEHIEPSENKAKTKKQKETNDVGTNA